MSPDSDTAAPNFSCLIRMPSLSSSPNDLVSSPIEPDVPSKGSTGEPEVPSKSCTVEQQTEVPRRDRYYLKKSIFGRPNAEAQRHLKTFQFETNSVTGSATSDSD
jgi:hypothetical protein